MRRLGSGASLRLRQSRGVDLNLMPYVVDVLLTIVTLGLLTLMLLLIGPAGLLILHRRLQRDGQEKEAEILRQALPDDADLPHICVQLPVYNEGAIVQRAIRAAAALDWPIDRLHIQILDDSSDNTSASARSVANELASFDISVLHRTNRVGFKAGALQAGMDAQPLCAYFAILDVDYLPPTDFLRLCMRPLLLDRTLAFSQARFDFLNADENALTKIQALMLDAHLGVEQATRSWAGYMLPFNGTCGIWRREAIDAAGGWRGDTLAEDLDLSYRAWIAGWRGFFLLSVAVPGELPSGSRAWASQQHRWAKGFGEVARRMVSVVSAARAKGWRVQLATLLHLSGWWSTPISLITAVAWFGVLFLRFDLWMWLLPPAALIVIASQVLLFLSLRQGNKTVRGGSMRWVTLLFLFVAAQSATVWVVLRNLRGYADVILMRSSYFNRTPKRGD